MARMRDIGKKIQSEQHISHDEITWLIVIAQAILRTFVWDQGRPIRELAGRLDMSPTTFYRVLRLAIEAVVWVRRANCSVEAFVLRVGALEARLAQATHVCLMAQRNVCTLSSALENARGTISVLQREVTRLTAQWTVMQDRLIVVLKMSGRCTVRSIVEVLDAGLGCEVSVGYVQGVIARAGKQARPLLERLGDVVPVSGAICIDEIFLKELGTRILGVVIVDPFSGLILRLTRCRDRTADTLEEVIKSFADAGFKDRITLCLTDMYAGYLKPVKTQLPKAVHQFCWFHIKCFHLGAEVYRAKRAYERAVKGGEDGLKTWGDTLSDAQRRQLQELVSIRDLAQRYWHGAQRFQRFVQRALRSSTGDQATARLDQLIRVAPRVQNPHIQKMGTFLAQHRDGLLTFYACLENVQHGLQRLSTARQQWVPVTEHWAVPITSNAAEHVFRCLRRYTNSMDHFGSPEATERFFDLFAFFHNVHTMRAGKRAGNSLLASAQIDIIHVFGSDDPYTILGFPPASQTFLVGKSVQVANE